MPVKEGKPASKPDTEAAGKDASAKDASAKGASAKGAAEKDVSAKDSAAKDSKDSAKDRPSAKRESAKADLPKDAPAKDPSAKAASKKPERELSAGRNGHKASERSSDKGHIVARDSRKYGDRAPTGRSGQKRARSRYRFCSDLSCEQATPACKKAQAIIGLHGFCKSSRHCLPVELLTRHQQ